MSNPGPISATSSYIPLFPRSGFAKPAVPFPVFLVGRISVIRLLIDFAEHMKDKFLGNPGPVFSSLHFPGNTFYLSGNFFPDRIFHTVPTHGLDAESEPVNLRYTPPEHLPGYGFGHFSGTRSGGGGNRYACFGKHLFSGSVCHPHISQMIEQDLKLPRHLHAIGGGINVMISDPIMDSTILRVLSAWGHRFSSFVMRVKHPAQKSGPSFGRKNSWTVASLPANCSLSMSVT